MNDAPLGHRALTDSRPSADVTLILLRVADLAAALLAALLRILQVVLARDDTWRSVRAMMQQASFSATC